MKKRFLIIAIILIVVANLSLQMIVNNTFAGQMPTGFKLNAVQTKVGDEINIELTLENEKAFLSLDFATTYDTTKLEYVSYEIGNIENFMVCANETTSGTIKIAGIQTPAQSRTVAANTTIIVLKFKVISGSGTESNIDLQCDSLYISEVDKAETVETASQVSILNVSGFSGNIITEDGYENAKAYLYVQATNTVVDESDIDTNGQYNLAATQTGEYYIKIEKPGYLDYFVKGIEITEINNQIKILNNIELIGGDLNDDGEIELMDLVKANDNLGNSVEQTGVNKQNVLNNYTKKSVEVNVSNLGYQDL